MHSFSQKPTYSNLLFQKILRDYQACSSKQASSLKKASRPQPASQVNQISQNKQLIDINKKMKVVRSTMMDDCDKENQATHINSLSLQEIGHIFTKPSQMPEPKTEETNNSNIQQLSSVEEARLSEKQEVKLSEIEEKYVDIENEAPLEKYWIDVEEVEKREQNNANQVQNKEVLEHQVEENDEDYPQIPMPIKQLSKCQLFDLNLNQPQALVSSQQQQMEPFLPIQMANQEKPAKVEQKLENIQVKNKISVRILTKKLKTQSPNKVLAELLRHRQIEIQGGETTIKVSQKDNICQALLSLIKHELIQ